MKTINMEQEQTFQFSRERRITNAMLIHGSSVFNIGLLNGKTGVVMYFYYLARKSGKQLYADFAEELLDEVIESLHLDMPLNFENGVAGIGWAVEHLVKKGFVDADTDEVLEDIDAKLATVDPDDVEILMGLALYYLKRLTGRSSTADQGITQNLTIQARRILKKLAILMVEPNYNPDLSAPDFAWLFPWYLWVSYSFEQIGVTGPEDTYSKRIDSILRGDIHPANKWFLELVTSAIQGEAPKMPDKILGTLSEPTAQKGLAGIILLLKIFAPNTKKSSEEIQKVQGLLENFTDEPSAYAGYALTESPENERIGILSGLAGIGLAGLM